MRLIAPLFAGAFVLWYTSEIMPDDFLAAMPYGQQYPDAVHVAAAIATFVLLALILRKRHSHF